MTRTPFPSGDTRVMGDPPPLRASRYMGVGMGVQPVMNNTSSLVTKQTPPKQELPLYRIVTVAPSDFHVAMLEGPPIETLPETYSLIFCLSSKPGFHEPHSRRQIIVAPRLNVLGADELGSQPALLALDSTFEASASGSSECCANGPGWSDSSQPRASNLDALSPGAPRTVCCMSLASNGQGSGCRNFWCTRRRRLSSCWTHRFADKISTTGCAR